MPVVLETSALQRTRKALEALVGGPMPSRTVPGEGGADLVLFGRGRQILVEYRHPGTAAQVDAAARHLRGSARRLGSTVIPVVSVPFMGEAGRRVCAAHQVNWIDLSGNAHIIVPGLRIEIAGHSNAFVRRGRPSNVFAPKSSRVARQLLMDPDKGVTQRGLSRATGLEEGFVSKIVRRLETDGLVVRDKSGAVRPRDPNLLLDAWSEACEFSTHQIMKGHMTARSGEELVRKMGSFLSKHRIEHAATGLGAAWLYSPFAAFRTVTFYIKGEPDWNELRRQGWREESEAPNLWLVIPKDEGVFFQGVVRKSGIYCVHPVQVYLDLQFQPERAREAAQHLRETQLKWKRHAR